MLDSAPVWARTSGPAAHTIANGMNRKIKERMNTSPSHNTVGTYSARAFAGINLGRLFSVLLLFSFALGPLQGQAPNQWTGSWAASQQLPEPQNSLSPDDLRDATLREIVHLSVGGRVLRVHVSNAFGTEPLHLSSVHVARPLSGVDLRPIESGSE